MSEEIKIKLGECSSEMKAFPPRVAELRRSL